MAEFFGIKPGHEFIRDGLRVAVSLDGERVWMHGKSLDLGESHAVACAGKKIVFERSDGRRLYLGEFPAWVVRSQSRKDGIAAMFCVDQFRGGAIIVDGARVAVPHVEHVRL